MNYLKIFLKIPMNLMTMKLLQNQNEQLSMLKVLKIVFIKETDTWIFIILMSFLYKKD